MIPAWVSILSSKSVCLCKDRNPEYTNCFHEQLLSPTLAIAGLTSRNGTVIHNSPSHLLDPPIQNLFNVSRFVLFSSEVKNLRFYFHFPLIKHSIT